MILRAISREFPWVTMALIFACVASWLLIQNIGIGTRYQLSVASCGVIPAVITGEFPSALFSQYIKDSPCLFGLQSKYFSLITHMFAHGGWFHIILNMVVLYMFGINVERAFGKIRFILFYFGCGLIAALFHILMFSDDLTPMVGASGAISGVLAAYVYMYPREKITVFLVVIPITMRAVYAIGGWFAIQLIAVLTFENTQIAFWAHIGGFITGLLSTAFIKPLLRRRTE